MVVMAVTRRGLTPWGTRRRPTVYPAQQSTARTLSRSPVKVPRSKATPRVAITSTTPSMPRAIPQRIRAVIRSSPSTPAKTATTVGTVDRMSALFDAVVRASPSMKASW